MSSRVNCNVTAVTSAYCCTTSVPSCIQLLTPVFSSRLPYTLWVSVDCRAKWQIAPSHILLCTTTQAALPRLQVPPATGILQKTWILFECIYVSFLLQVGSHLSVSPLSQLNTMCVYHQYPERKQNGRKNIQINNNPQKKSRAKDKDFTFTQFYRLNVHIKPIHLLAPPFAQDHPRNLWILRPVSASGDYVGWSIFPILLPLGLPSTPCWSDIYSHHEISFNFMYAGHSSQHCGQYWKSPLCRSQTLSSPVPCLPLLLEHLLLDYQMKSDNMLHRLPDWDSLTLDWSLWDGSVSTIYPHNLAWVIQIQGLHSSSPNWKSHLGLWLYESFQIHTNQ